MGIWAWVLYGLTLTGATPGRNKRTSAGNIRCKCSSTALPKASSACSTEGTAEKLPLRSAAANTAIILGNKSGRCRRNSSCSAVASSSHSRNICRNSWLGPQKEWMICKMSSRYRRT